MLGRITAIALLSLAPPSLAQAQIASPSCDLLKSLAEAAPSGLADYRGAAFPQPSTRYASNLQLPGFTCAVDASPATNAFLCYSASMPAGGASARYDQELDRIRACFPGWSERPPIPQDETLISMEKGVRLVQDFAGRELSIGLALGRLSEGRRVEHRLGFGVVWAKPTS